MQLINKCFGDKITDHEVTEFEVLMPALGEIFKTCEEMRTFQNVSCGVHKELIERGDVIDDHVNEIKDNKMQDISTSINKFKAMLSDLV